MIPDIILSYFQLCGVRGGGNAAAQALFWQAKKGVSFVLAFESERERNATIMLARRFAFDCNVGVYNIFLFYFIFSSFQQAWDFEPDIRTCISLFFLI